MRLVLVLALVGCNGKGSGDSTTPGGTTGATPTGTGTASGTATGTATGSTLTSDADGDGVTVAAGDCDDGDAAVYPGHADVCGNDADDACSGLSGDCGWSGPQTFDGVAISGHLDDAYAGQVVALCDVGGDGVGDLVIGAGHAGLAGARSGGVFVFDGPVAASALTDAADHAIAGAAADAYTGWGLGCGDGDGDGVADVAIGAPTASGRGAVHLVRGGAALASSTTAATATWTAEYASDRLGGSIAAFDDDGDGDVSFAASLISGTTGSANEWGAVYVFPGDATGTTTADLGQAAIYGGGDDVYDGVASGGDLSGDGNEELLLRGSRSSGAIYDSVFVFRGPVTGVMYKGDADYRIDDGDTITGLGAGGRGMAHADLDLDGLDDLILSNPQRSSNTGGVYVWMGGLATDSSVVLSTAKLYGELAGEQFGSSVASPGDLDGDGHAELLVGSASAGRLTAGGGAVYLFYGPFAGTADATSAAARWDTSVEVTLEGPTLAVGDLDGDPAPDVAVGAPYTAGGGVARGTVWLLEAWNL